MAYQIWMFRMRCGLRLLEEARQGALAGAIAGVFGTWTVLALTDQHDVGHTFACATSNEVRPLLVSGSAVPAVRTLATAVEPPDEAPWAAGSATLKGAASSELGESGQGAASLDWPREWHMPPLPSGAFVQPAGRHGVSASGGAAGVSGASASPGKVTTRALPSIPQLRAAVAHSTGAVSGGS